MSGSLSVAFTGLMALVGSGDGRPVDVLLLDAPALGEVRGVALPAHAPTLVVSLNDLANPDTSAPTRIVAGRTGPAGRVQQLGLWDLSGAEVRIRTQGEAGEGVRFFRPAEGETSWPEPPKNVADPSAWRDIRYVADMESLVGDGRIDPRLLREEGGADNRLPRSIAARIRLDAGLIEAGIPSQSAYQDDRFEFAGGGSHPAVRQALTDTVRWTLRTGDSAVSIDIIPVNGGPTSRLLLAASAEPHSVYVSNLPVKNLPSGHAHHGISDEEMAALHFGAYYELLLRQPTGRPLPTLLPPRDARRGSGLIQPIMCPPALFTRS